MPVFDLARHRTTVRTEILAGCTTFLTMAYIMFLNPAILAEAEMDFGAVFVATCVSAAFGSFAMGLLANYPVALAPGMGLNAFFTFVVVQNQGASWQTALGAVFIAGVAFVVLSVLPVREWLINAIPRALKLGIAAGIGLFLAFIGLRNAGLVVASSATFVELGPVREPGPLHALGGFAVMVALDRRGVPGAVLIGVLAITALSATLGYVEWRGVFALPPDPRPTLMQLDIGGALHLGMLGTILTFLLIDLFDNAGTLVGVAHEAGMLDADGRLPRLGRALLADSSACVVGAMLGTSSVTSYVESAAGVKAGGRTGLTAVTVGVLFLLALFLSPLAQSVPLTATAPALIYVGCIMTRALAELDWRDASDYAPAVLTAIAMPLTFSISDGIGLGFLTYAGAKLVSGRERECGAGVWIVSALFAMKFLVLD
jgi:AGZA family xanthine/uracil permease-like MFS transporter